MLPWLSILTVIAAFAYPLFDFFSNRAKQPEYQAFPFVLAAIGYLAYQRLRAAKQEPSTKHQEPRTSLHDSPPRSFVPHARPSRKQEGESSLHSPTGRVDKVATDSLHSPTGRVDEVATDSLHSPSGRVDKVATDSLHSPSGRVDEGGEGSLSLIPDSRLESNAMQAPPAGKEAEPLNSAVQSEPGTSNEPSVKNSYARTLRLTANLAYATSSLLVLGGVFVWSPWVIFVGLIFLLLGVVISLRVTHHTEGLLAVWALMWLLLPLPLNLDKELTTKLQLLSSWLSSQLLEAVGVLHLLRGNNLHIASKELFVDEACSGIVSLLTIISAIAIYCVWLRRSLVHAIAMILLGICWTVLMNTLRIVTIAAALDWYGLDWSEGTSHTILAVVLFVISLGVLKLLDGFLDEFFQPIDTEDHPMGEEQWKRSGFLIRLWDRWFANSREEADGRSLESVYFERNRRAHSSATPLAENLSGSATPLAEKESNNQPRTSLHDSPPRSFVPHARPSRKQEGESSLHSPTGRVDKLATDSLHSPTGRVDEVGEGSSNQPSTKHQAPRASRSDSIQFKLPIAVLAVMVVAAISQFWTVPESTAQITIQDAAFDKALALQESDNPSAKVENIKLVSFKVETREVFSIWGEQSRVWTYQDETGVQYQVSLDFLFGPDWHDTKWCYSGVGWTVSNYKVRDEVLSEALSQSVISFDLGREDAMIGYTTYLGFRSDGSSVMRVVTEDDGVYAPVARTFLQSIFDRFTTQKRDTDIGPYYQLQVVTFGRAISDVQKQTAKQLLLEARKTLADKLKGS